MSDGQHPAMLASDAERERTVESLRGAVVEGRLTLEEFSDRVGLAHAGRTDQSVRIYTSGPGGTLHVRHRDEPSRWSKRLGRGDE